MAKILSTLFVLLLCGCSSVTIGTYESSVTTKDALSRASGTYVAGAVSGQTGVVSDQLLKSSLPCRLQTFKTPSQEPVAVYIANALKTELQGADKSAPDGRRIDIMIVRLESDTSKIRNGRWALDFIYKIGRVSRDIQTTTEYPFNADASIACYNTADAFAGALRENFEKFFKTLH